MKTKVSDRGIHGQPSRGRAEHTCLRVSFEYLDWETKEFFLHGFDAEFYVRLFNCLETIQTCSQEQLEKQNHPSLNCKAIFKSSTGSHDDFPRGVVDKIATKLRQEGEVADPMVEAVRIARLAFEVSMGKNQGRLHGFLWNKAFNLVWFDPAHNLYPGDQKLRGPQQVMQVKSGAHAELLRLKDVIESLSVENSRLAKDFDQLLEEWVVRSE
jgi:hypothetical protein